MEWPDTESECESTATYSSYIPQSVFDSITKFNEANPFISDAPLAITSENLKKLEQTPLQQLEQAVAESRGEEQKEEPLVKDTTHQAEQASVVDNEDHVLTRVNQPSLATETESVRSVPSSTKTKYYASIPRPQQHRQQHAVCCEEPDLRDLTPTQRELVEKGFGGFLSGIDAAYALAGI